MAATFHLSNSPTRKQLLSPYKLSSYPLQSHLVMSPMTRNREIGNVTNDLMVKSYAQRATAGLIVTEGTSPPENGLGDLRILEIFQLYKW
jgi:N-ethylmaleimide reductase